MFSNEESIVMRSTNVVIQESIMDKVTEALNSVFRDFRDSVVEILDTIGFKYNIFDDGGVQLLFYSGCLETFAKFVDAVCPYVSSGNGLNAHMACVDSFGETMTYTHHRENWSVSRSGLAFQR